MVECLEVRGTRLTVKVDKVMRCGCKADFLWDVGSYGVTAVCASWNAPTNKKVLRFS